MKNILVPTDFSENAEHALYYAMDLAKHEGAHLILLNAYTTDYDSSPAEENILEDFRQMSLAKLKGLAPKLAHAGGISFDTVSIAGSAQNTILHFSKECKADLIVMGTKGESDLFSAIFGSNTANIIARAECPVIAVPKGCKFGNIKHITYATDYKQSDIAALKKLLEIARPYKAQINVLHISSDKVSPEEEVQMMAGFKEKVAAALDYTDLSFQMLCSGNIESELRDYLETGAADLLVMSTHKGGIVDRFFGDSLTQTVSHFSEIPVMAFHHKKSDVKIFT